MSASSKKKLRKEQNVAALTEKQLNEQKEAKKLKKQTITFVVIIALVLAIGLGSLAVTAYNNSGIAERNTTALTIGEHKLSAAELSYFYFDAINAAYSDWYNNYGDYTATYVSLLYGLDVTKPLDEQIYDKDTNKTFADYFIDIAIEDAVSAYTVYDLAAASGDVLDKDDIASIDNTVNNLKVSSVNAGYNSVANYLKSVYGNGANEKSFRKYLELLVASNNFQADIYNGFTYTDGDLSDYNEENFDKFSSFSYCSFYLSPSDFLVCTADEDDKDHEHSEEEQSAAMEAAKAAAASIVDAKPVNAEELNKVIQGLSAYAENDSAVCTENTDLIYTSISDEGVAQWLADGDRKAGDITVVTNANETTDEDGNTVTEPYGFTIVVFLSRNDNEMKLVNVRHILKAFTDGITDENGNTVYPAESISKAEDAITTLRDTWVNGGKTQDSFAKLAVTSSDDSGSATSGGLYENVYPGQMVPSFNDWCFDEARQPGDYDIVETKYGYHLIYFVDRSPVTFRNYMIENTMRNDDYSSWYQDQLDAAEYTVNDTSKLRTNVSIVGY